MTQEVKHTPRRVFKKELTVKKTPWRVEAWIGPNGKANCTIYKGETYSLGRFSGTTYRCVSEDELAVVPAKVIKANVEGLDKAEAEARGQS